MWFICLDRIEMEQFQVHSSVGLFVSFEQINIPQISDDMFSRRNKPHHSKCCVGFLNVGGDDSNDSGFG